MKIISYNQMTGTPIADPATSLSFGTVTLGQHCGQPAVIRPAKTVETNILAMKVFLQADGGLTGSAFGYYTHGIFQSGIDYKGSLYGGVTGGTTGSCVSGYTGGITGLPGITGSTSLGYTGGITGISGLTGAIPLGATGGTTGLPGITGSYPSGYTGGIALGTTGGVTGGIFNHFTLAEGATGWPVASPYLEHGVDIGISGGAPSDYLWLDVQLGLSGTPGPASINYRFCYDYN